MSEFCVSPRKGVDAPLPADIKAGIEAVAQREGWNRPATAEYALPTETWREHIARRQRCLDLRAKLAHGEVTSINDLITHNLDIRQFAQDVIASCEGSDLLRAFYQAISQVSVLDPTCGSGAFLFAALNILEPLYTACLERMQGFVEDEDTLNTVKGKVKTSYEDFRHILAEMKQHHNQRYFILKSIILNNLYGVDIMEEATEICKLRLFLKLVSQVEVQTKLPNFGLEPLPDIDFNIRSGNSLVGYVNLDEIFKAIFSDEGMVTKSKKTKKGNQGNLFQLQQSGDVIPKVEIVHTAFQRFRKMQTSSELKSEEFKQAKKDLRVKLGELNNELNYYLAREYGVDIEDKSALDRWQSSHQPFHWFVDFYKIVSAGGFDVIIGNPPYVETSKIKDYKFINYQTKDCGNIYAPCVEKASSLMSNNGTFGMIVPLSGFSTERMKNYQDLVYDNFPTLHISHYSGDANPSVLFAGVKYRLCIVLGHGQGKNQQLFSTSYMRWYADERETLFSRIQYHLSSHKQGFLRYAKTGNHVSGKVLARIMNKDTSIQSYLLKSGNHTVNYHRSPVSWIRSMNFEPYFKSLVKDRSTDHLKDLFFETEDVAIIVGAILNSTCFYYWFSIQGNCRNIAGSDIESFPIGKVKSMNKPLKQAFSNLMEDLQKHSKRRIYEYQQSGKVEYDEFYPSKSKAYIDEIDRVLAQHYGFTDEELDFIINYDIKYRMGRDSGEEE